jgi:hypothetical protein
MKSFVASATEIVRRILERIDDKEDYTSHIKDVMDLGQDDYWSQIDGDANPWVWGGSWYNPGKNEVVHFEGTDYEGSEIDWQDIEVPAQVLAKLPPEQKDWRENAERDKIIEQYKIARTAFLNNRKQYDFWRFHVAPAGDFLYRQYADKVAAAGGISLKEFEKWSLPNRWIEIGRYIGFHEIADRFKMNYQEAQAFLGANNV